MKNRVKYTKYVLIALSFLFIVSIDAADKKLDPRSIAASKGLKVSFEKGRLPTSVMQIRLALSQFSEIDVEYERLFNQYKKNPIYEARLHYGFKIFDEEGGISGEHLERWVKATGSAYAYTAKGNYYLNLGYSARGTNYASETSDEQFSAMKKFHHQAFEAFNQAIKIKPDLTPAYSGMISLARASLMPLSVKQIVDKALEKDKRTYYVRANYLSAIEPRWGGSLEMMHAFSLDAARFSNLNPRLWALQGEAYAEAGTIAKQRKGCEMAIKLYSKALTYGDSPPWLMSRGRCYSKINKNDKAMSDFKKVLFYNPKDDGAMQWVRWLESKK